MNVAYSEAAKNLGEGYVLLQQATTLLEECIGKSARTATAEWDRAEDVQGQTLYTLRLSHQTETVTASFTLDELASPRKMSFRLLRLWGDLLQVRSHKQIEAMLGSAES